MVLKVLLVLCRNYESEFKEYVPESVDIIFKIVDSSVDEYQRYDNLVTECIGFLTTVAKQQWHKQLFDDAGALNALVNILIRNIKLRASDFQKFESEGEEYVAQDMEGSDLYTRRRGATELVTGLCHHFQQQISLIIAEKINECIDKYEIKIKSQTK